MLKEERYNYILKELDRVGKVLVEDLSQYFDVSTETIRRDLDYLEKRNKLKKVHGGAIKLASNTIEEPFHERQYLHLEEKKIIGKKASLLVQDGFAVGIDAGTTTLQVIPFLIAYKNLTIITPSIPAVTLIASLRLEYDFCQTVVFIGGVIDMNTMSSSGVDAEKSLNDYTMDISFIAAGGISAEGVITDYSINETSFSRKMIQRSKQSYVLLDSSKFGVVLVRKTCLIDEVSGIISDKDFMNFCEVSNKTT